VNELYSTVKLLAGLSPLRLAKFVINGIVVVKRLAEYWRLLMEVG
jgi:hypothetical protein